MTLLGDIGMSHSLGMGAIFKKVGEMAPSLWFGD
jgi:hypothetical protein